MSTVRYMWLKGVKEGKRERERGRERERYRERETEREGGGERLRNTKRASDTTHNNYIHVP